jgi:nitric oxide reductase subunit B
VVTPDGVLFTTRAFSTARPPGNRSAACSWARSGVTAPTRRPDWTADWLHRELTAWLDLAAQQVHGKPYAALDADAQAGLRERLKREYRSNRVRCRPAAC